MKSLKFTDPLPELILAGKKTSTWRVDDEKDILPGDELSLCDIQGREFAMARVTRIRLTTFSSLDADDWKGHESFASEEEMYKTYSAYYGKDIGPGTAVKVIQFKLVCK